MALTENLKNFMGKCRRVWLVLKKPTKKEFSVVAKISAIGVLLLGVLGFIISMIMEVFV